MIGVSVLSGCGGGGTTLPIGKYVVVQFDRSSLGAGADLPVSPTAQRINGAATAVSGRLVDVDEHWIRVEASADTSEHETRTIMWIPRSKVLMIQFRETKKR